MKWDGAGMSMLLCNVVMFLCNCIMDVLFGCVRVCVLRLYFMTCCVVYFRVWYEDVYAVHVWMGVWCFAIPTCAPTAIPLHKPI